MKCENFEFKIKCKQEISQFFCVKQLCMQCIEFISVCACTEEREGLGAWVPAAKCFKGRGEVLCHFVGTIRHRGGPNILFHNYDEFSENWTIQEGIISTGC